VNLRAGKKKVPTESDVHSICPIVVGNDSDRKMGDKMNHHCNIGRTKECLSCKGEKLSQPHNIVGSDEVQEKTNGNNNVAAVGDDYQK